MKKATSIFAAVFVLHTGMAGFSHAQDENDRTSGPLVKLLSAVDVDEKVNGEAARASTVEVTFEPGVSGSPHRHPGPVFGYVIEGEFEFKIEGKPKQTLKAGETFYEPLLVLHEIGRNPSDKAQTRVLAVILHPRDAKQLVIPEQPQKEK